ncbi:MAG: hypothetical protein CVV64_09370 [Candidatus Wallbacteria bacterium HGW-Wallbacteria-1]|uniref:General secretion pathway protein GspK n=1 Tax=Candidatus Wallbacteria bacterium HGW-Wallbacteria-1 TaxID=2013854 RepID=A0A2N1PQE4_9BACT|nr:MAG: hypothetical protein CVV64_09370 [Candidatus Wallbacteria bacterium HGW-Wallbacteria-1]
MKYSEYGSAVHIKITSQNGSVLLTVLLLISLMTLSAFSYISEARRDLLRLKYAKMDLAARNGAYISLVQAHFLLMSDSWNTDSLEDSWQNPETLPGSEMTIQDEESLINILKAPETFIKNIAFLLKPEADHDQLLEKVGQLRILDSDSHTESLQLYSKLNSFFSDFPELAKFTTIRGDGKININTAPELIIQAIMKSEKNTLPAERVEEILRKRPFRSINDIERFFPSKNSDGKSIGTYLKVCSREFSVECRISNVLDESSSDLSAPFLTRKFRLSREFDTKNEKLISWHCTGAHGLFP